MTAASLICFLIVGLVGVVSSDQNLYMFRINTTDLQIDPLSLESLASSLGVDNVPGVSSISSRSPVKYTDAITALSSSKASSSSSSSSLLTTNITAADLGLADVYDINLWGYCTTDTSGNRNCTKSKFSWADTYLNTTSLITVGTDAGLNVTLPTTVTDALNAFKQLTKWTEVVYIVATIALGIELFIGLFTWCSRVISCITYIVSGIAGTFAIAAAVCMTVTAAVVIGAVEGSAKYYGVTGSINTNFLAAIWIGVAFCLGASFFWLFSCCCCKRDHHEKRRSAREDEKPFLPGGSGYAPLHDNRASYGYNNQVSGGHRQQTNARSDLAYEPYSHSNV